MQSIIYIIKNYIVILLFLSSIDTYSQAHFLDSWLGNTKEETLELISKTNDFSDDLSMQLYEIKDEKIILTYQWPNFAGAKAILYFKNEISYKVEIAFRSSKYTGNQILDHYYRKLHNAFFEEKSKELGTDDMKYEDGKVRRFFHTSKYRDFSNSPDSFFIDEYGRSPLFYGDYGCYSKIMVFSKPGLLIYLDYNYGGVSQGDNYYNSNIPLGAQKLVMIIEVKHF